MLIRELKRCSRYAYIQARNVIYWSVFMRNVFQKKEQDRRYI